MEQRNNAEKIKRLIYETIDDVNQELPAGALLTKSDDAVLLGPGSPLDSLALVSMIVGVEQRLQDAFNVTLSLADARAFSQRGSPFRTVESMAHYIEMRLNELKA